MICCCSSPICEKYGCQSWAAIKPLQNTGQAIPIPEPVRPAWVCPHCNRANAPWMPFCCKPGTETITGTLK